MDNWTPTLGSTEMLNHYKQTKLLTHVDSDFLLSPPSYANSLRREAEGGSLDLLKVQVLSVWMGSINGEATRQHRRSIDLRRAWILPSISASSGVKASERPTISGSRRQLEP